MTTTRPYSMTVKEAQESARISTGNSKMPGTTFAQDSFACKVGDKLAKIEGSVCKSCYARRIAQGGSIPGNLVLRVSATMIGDAPIRGHANTSTVHVKGKPHVGHACPAPSQGNSCGSADLGNECRACWNPSVGNVSYAKH